VVRRFPFHPPRAWIDWGATILSLRNSSIASCGTKMLPPIRTCRSLFCAIRFLMRRSGHPVRNASCLGLSSSLGMASPFPIRYSRYNRQ
jgi:hypothetical protein